MRRICLEKREGKGIPHKGNCVCKGLAAREAGKLEETTVLDGGMPLLCCENIILQGLGGETATFHPTEAERTESCLETEEGVHEQA